MNIIRRSRAVTVASVVISCLLLQIPVSSFAADATPAPVATPVPVATAVSKYQQALADYTAANSAYNSTRALAGVSLKTVQSAFQLAQKAYTRAFQARNQAVRAISLKFAMDVQVATRNLRQALKSAATSDAKNIATGNFNAAVTLASSTRDAALSQLGALPDGPARPFVPMPPVPAPGRNGGGQSDNGQSGND
mgnify:CR=1 FL=1